MVPDAARPPQRSRMRIRREHRRWLTEVDHPSVEVVVVPCSDEINAAENALSLALVALLSGTRPPVTLAMVREHLRVGFGIDDAAMSVMRHAPKDFIVHFSRREDLERVLAAPPDSAAPFTLTWRRWTRLSRAIAASFTFRVVVGIKGVPAHALSESVAQQLLGSSCAQVELAIAEADGIDDDDARELFIVAWCHHPLLVPKQKLLIIPEPQEPHDPDIQFLREHEIIHSHLPILHYLAQMHVVKY